MKKIFVFFLIIILFLSSLALVSGSKVRNIDEDLEIRGIYISYLEYLTYFQGNALSINKSYINKILDNVSSLGFNTIFLHVSPFSDSIYKSEIFPYSYTLSGVEGKNPGMDYLDYFIREAKKRNLKVHAWINPYRISLESDTSKISKTNPAYMMLATGEAKASSEGIYYNPASPKTIDLILKQVYELISKYHVDGIHFDDYFYVDQEIDKDNYLKYMENNPNITLSDYRLNLVNTMIKSVYKLIKEYDSNIIFSIAPDGNIENDYTYNFADVKTWLKEKDYVDIIMPQVYYGFDNQYKPFLETIKNWNDLIENDTKLIPVLAFYKVGLIDNMAGSGKNEWIENNNIIERQINYIKTLNKYNGFTLFRYDYLFNDTLENNNTKIELSNLKKAIK